MGYFGLLMRSGINGDDILGKGIKIYTKSALKLNLFQHCSFSICFSSQLTTKFVRNWIWSNHGTEGVEFQSTSVEIPQRNRIWISTTSWLLLFLLFMGYQMITNKLETSPWSGETKMLFSYKCPAASLSFMFIPPTDLFWPRKRAIKSIW